MVLLHSLLIKLHIVVGAFALVLFWLPAATRKGGRWHVMSGRAYVVAMYTVALSSLLASLMVLADPIAIRHPGELLEAGRAAELAARYRSFSLFLLMLSVLVLVSLRHGIVALRERRHPGAINRPIHKASMTVLTVLGVIVGALGLMKGQILLMVFGGLSVAVGGAMIRDARQASRGELNTLTAHLGALIGSGIGAYTAFFAFGGARFLADVLPGQWQVIPWVLPSVIGILAIRRVQRRYERGATGVNRARRTVDAGKLPA